MTSSKASDRAIAPVRGREIGSQIAGVFGAVFVWVNSTAIPPLVRVALLAVAGSALVVIVLLSIRSFRQHSRAQYESSAHAGEPNRESSRSPFSWKYWCIVGVEAVALFGGSRIITALGYPELGVAWVAFVVGTHFFALARIFHLARFHALGAIVTALAIAGFVLRAFGQVEQVAVVSGVLSGFALLGFGLWAFTPTVRSR